MSWQIAIDGPAGAGKSTIAKEVAKELGFEYVDTGAMYRAVTLKAMKLGINMEDEKEYSFLEDTEFDFRNHKIYLDNIDVSDDIRTLAVSNNVSLVSKFKYVRTILVHLQRKLANDKNVIMDGRDIGSVVLPNAFLKIFLNANVEERAKRRMSERVISNNNSLSYLETIEEIKVRDYKDSNREVSPLIKTSDAIEIDSSKLNVRTVVEMIISLVIERGYRMENLEKKSETIVEETVVEETKQEELVVEEKEAKKAAPKKAPKAKEAEAVVEETVVEEKQEELVVEEKEAKKAAPKKAPKAKEAEAVVEETVVEEKQEELAVKDKETAKKETVKSEKEDDVDD
ncbi:MAG TPA: (d)CMP kinase, partial [Acholeplasmataceae bacterium]|nr:(d)CMP kinase [Acholeplasmataceae bacterium]